LLVPTEQTFSTPPPLFQFHLAAHPDYPQFSQLHWDGPSDLSLDDLSLSSPATPLAPTREHILRILQQQPTTDPMTIPALLELLPHLSYELLRKTLQRMVRDHQLSSPRRGLYALPISLSSPDPLSPLPVPNAVPNTVPNTVSPSAVPNAVPNAVSNTVSPSAVPNPLSPPSTPSTFSHKGIPQAVSIADIQRALSPSPIPNHPSKPITHKNIL
jgi:hypothetical protein